MFSFGSSYKTADRPEICLIKYHNYHLKEQKPQIHGTAKACEQWSRVDVLIRMYCLLWYTVSAAAAAAWHTAVFPKILEVVDNGAHVCYKLLKAVDHPEWRLPAAGWGAKCKTLVHSEHMPQ